MPIALIGCLLAGTLGVIAPRPPACEKSQIRPFSQTSSPIAAGRYSVVLVATKGRQKRQRVVGTLTLKPTSSLDVSPRTGETAQDRHLAETPLYGALEANLSGVDAPMCSGEPNPDTASMDPVYPGVLLHFIEWEDRYPKPTPVLTIGTLSNLRNGKDYFDGCGIGLFVTRTEDASLFGEWDRWGIVGGGSGYFCAYRTGDAQCERSGR